jgi:Stage II sporulation protein E (SpoIIE)
MTPDLDDEHRQLLRLAFRQSGLTLDELWMRYFGLGGDAGRVEMEAHLEGLMPLPPLQSDILAHAVNERLDELAPPRRAPYSRRLPEQAKASGPLAALTSLLVGTHLAPPDRLPALAAAASRMLGVGVSMYLVDYDQLRLVPAVAPGEPLSVEGTVAGRAFQVLQAVDSEVEGQPRLWIPLLDGAERLGVLDVTFDQSWDLADPVLREQVWWLAKLLGHLVMVTNQYGDALEQVRRQQPRSPSAELVWNLLPPLTAGTGNFLLAGLTEPNSRAGGDAFDYALSENTASLALLDPMGHGLHAALMSAAALAAYRSARRDGQLLHAQVDAIDRTIAAEFDGAFVTGILAELDLTSGQLKYLVAGHPPPLLLRGGRIVKTLSGGHRSPLGLPAGRPIYGKETLEPGDLLALYTDGVTEARNPAGDFFGEARLVDFLRREAAAGYPPPETVRRLIHAVMNYQQDDLHDDATILLARWDPARHSDRRSHRPR